MNNSRKLIIELALNLANRQLSGDGIVSDKHIIRYLEEEFKLYISEEELNYVRNSSVIEDFELESNKIQYYGTISDSD